MKLQIVNSLTDEPIFTKQGLKLEADIPGHKSFPWWRLVKRHSRKVLLRDLESLLSDLRDQTRLV